MLLAYAISPYMSKQGGPRSVFFRNSIWVQMVSVVDRCKRVLVTLIRTLAGLYACSEESWLRTPLNTFSIEKNNENQAFSWAVEAPVASFRQSLNGASTHFQLKKQAFSWALEAPVTSFQQSLNRASTHFQLKKTMKIKNYLEPLRLPSQAFGTTSREPQRIINWKKQCKINFFDSLRPLVTLAF